MVTLPLQLFVDQARHEARRLMMRGGWAHAQKLQRCSIIHWNETLYRQVFASFNTVTPTDGLCPKTRLPTLALGLSSRRGCYCEARQLQFGPALNNWCDWDGAAMLFKHHGSKFIAQIDAILQVDGRRNPHRPYTVKLFVTSALVNEKGTVIFPFKFKIDGQDAIRSRALICFETGQPPS